MLPEQVLYYNYNLCIEFTDYLEMIHNDSYILGFYSSTLLMMKVVYIWLTFSFKYSAFIGRDLQKYCKQKLEIVVVHFHLLNFKLWSKKIN